MGSLSGPRSFVDMIREVMVCASLTFWVKRILFAQIARHDGA